MKNSAHGFRIFGVLTVLMTGCGGLDVDHTPSSIILPPHIKTIAVKPFDNQTTQPAIGQKLWLAVTEEFVRDGRFAYSDNIDKAEGVIVGAITQYHETELSHDVNLIPREYQLWVIMDLKFLDQTNNQYLWHEPYLEQKLRYFVETEPGGKTSEEAREDLWDRFSKDIVRRTIDGFGSVTSKSPRSIPKDPPPTNPPPRYPSTSPY